MVLIPEEDIPATYARFMEQVKMRIAAAQRAMRDSYEKRGSPDSFLMAEFAVLQIRRVAELIALAVLVAHNEIADFRTKKFVKQWNAEAIFSHLAKLSDTAFPEPFTMSAADEDDVVDIFIDATGHMSKSELASIYSKCGERLHAGALKSLEKPKQHSLGEIQTWCNRIVHLLNHHVVLLPEMKKSMVVIMASNPDGNVSCRLETLVNEPKTGRLRTARSIRA